MMSESGNMNGKLFPILLHRTITGLYDVIQESVEKETGKLLFNLGSCGLDIPHDDFRNRCNAAKWNIEYSLFCLGLLFKHSPTRREDFTKV
jgi:hypothetical protein